MDNAQGNYAQGSGDFGRRDCEHCGLKNTPYCDKRLCDGNYIDNRFLLWALIFTVCVWIFIFTMYLRA
jgi:hypothetical protein